MSTILSENFDGVTAPALPSSMTFDAGYATDGSNFITSPNALVFSATGAVRHAETTANDGNSGNAQTSISVRMENLGVNKEVFVFVRRTASTTEYSAAWNGGSGDPEGLKLYKRIGGSFTQLGSTISVVPSNNAYYRVWVKAVGTTISAQVQRASDSFWLQPGGTFSSGQVDAISVTDSSITGAGTAGGCSVRRLLVRDGERSGPCFWNAFFYDSYKRSCKSELDRRDRRNYILYLQGPPEHNGGFHAERNNTEQRNLHRLAIRFNLFRHDRHREYTDFLQDSDG